LLRARVTRARRLSAALGMAAARDKNGTDENVVCIFGDAALTERHFVRGAQQYRPHDQSGSSASSTTNEWSIAKNVGAISNYPQQAHHESALTTSSRAILKTLVRRLPKGELALKLAHKAGGPVSRAPSPGVGCGKPGSLVDTDGRGGYGSPVLF